LARWDGADKIGTMKNLKQISVVGLALLALLFSSNARADLYSSAEIQSGLMGAVTSKKEIKTDVKMVISIPAFNQIEPIVFKASANVPYAGSGSSVILRGRDMPVMMTELIDVPDMVKPLTITMGIKEKVIKVSVKDGKLEIPEMDINMALYIQTRKIDVKPSTEPTLEMKLKNVEIEIDEFNPRDREVLLGFSTKFPKTDNDLFNEYLAGKKLDADIDIEFE